MRFSKWLIQEANEDVEEINDIFNKAAEDIKQLFGQLYQGTANMVRSYEKAQLPEELQRQIVSDLEKIIGKVKSRKPSQKELFDLYNKKENIINDIKESIIQDMGSHGTGPGGKPVYDFKSTITNMYRLVMDRMTKLKDSVLKHMGIIRDTQSKVLGLRSRTGEIRNLLNSQPFTPEEEDKAEDSMIAITNAYTRLGNDVKLIDKKGKTIVVDPESEEWKKQVLRSGSIDKRFTLVIGNNKEVVNMGNPTDITRVLGRYLNETPPEIKPTSGHKVRARKVRGIEGTALDPGSAPRQRRRKK